MGNKGRNTIFRCTDFLGKQNRRRSSLWLAHYKKAANFSSLWCCFPGFRFLFVWKLLFQVSVAGRSVNRGTVPEADRVNPLVSLNPWLLALVPFLPWIRSAKTYEWVRSRPKSEEKKYKPIQFSFQAKPKRTAHPRPTLLGTGPCQSGRNMPHSGLNRTRP